MELFKSALFVFVAIFGFQSVLALKFWGLSSRDRPKSENLESSQDLYANVFGPGVYQLTEPLLHGEGPTWDPRTELLYFVDIDNGQVYSYNPKTGVLFYIQLNGTVTPVVQSRNSTDQFYVGVNRSLFRVNWDGQHELESAVNLTTVAQNFPTSRFNDGKADSRGRLWFGTMGYEDASGVRPNAGSLYMITRENLQDPTVVISPVNVSNGLTWNQDNTKFFYIDTPTYNVMEYNFDEETGQISNPRVIVNLRDELGANALPDGMTIDSNGLLWVALHGAGSVVRIDPVQGTILRRIAVPAQFVTSCMWGGRNLDILFVTTSRVQLNEVQRRQQPASGSLFAIRGLDASGLPVYGGDV